MIQIGAPSATIDSPVEHLMACHRRIEDRLDTLTKAADFLRIDRASAFAAIANSLAFLDSSGALHTEDEENSLFPRLRAKLGGDQIAYLDSLEQQHGEAEGVLSRLKQLVNVGLSQDPVSGALMDQYRECAEELRSLYRSHIRSEDQILVALAKRSLSESELSGISSEMRERRAASPRL